jgi:hypothetical protein
VKDLNFGGDRRNAAAEKWDLSIYKALEEAGMRRIFDEPIGSISDNCTKKVIKPPERKFIKF